MGANEVKTSSITALLVAELSIEGERMPVFVHLIDHPDGRVLVDTGMTEIPESLADFVARIMPLTDHGIDLATIDMVVNSHLHADHCGGNRLFAGTPIFAQRAELEDARTQPEYTLREWVDAPGVEYEELDGERELLPGIRILPAPGHTRGSQIVVVATDAGRAVIAGDTAVWSDEVDNPRTEGQKLIRSLAPAEVWLAHEDGPWTPSERS